MANNFHNLKVAKVVSETADAKSVYFDIPEGLKDTFFYQPGQYLTLNFDVDGTNYRRAYSICTSPLDGQLAVTVKRVVGGKNSNHINDTITQGSEIAVMPPMGKFTVDIKASNRTDYYMFAGGSGITPMMSILKTVLEKEPNSVCNLLYGNRNEDSIIFEEIFKNLEQKYGDRLNIRHILSTPEQKKVGGLAGLFGKKKFTWTGWYGFLDQNKINTFISNHLGQGDQQKFLICGPSIMMDLVTESLRNLAIPKENVLVEYFASPKKETDETVKKTFLGTAKVTVALENQQHIVEIGDDTTILDALIKKGIEAPYSCSSGACSTCMAKLTKGTVSMDACYALEDEELANGFILTCQSHPTSEEVEVDYNVVNE